MAVELSTPNTARALHELSSLFPIGYMPEHRAFLNLSPAGYSKFIKYPRDAIYAEHRRQSPNYIFEVHCSVLGKTFCLRSLYPHINNFAEANVLKKWFPNVQFEF